jgi:MinD-like ATPase involved in chromosome partitioning or flagellar assembly
MAYFKCPACGAVHRPLGKLEVGESRVLAEIPLDPELADAIDKGELVEYVASSTSEAAQALRRLAAAVAGAVEAG